MYISLISYIHTDTWDGVLNRHDRVVIKLRACVTDKLTIDEVEKAP